MQVHDRQLPEPKCGPPGQSLKGVHARGGRGDLVEDLALTSMWQMDFNRSQDSISWEGMGWSGRWEPLNLERQLKTACPSPGVRTVDVGHVLTLSEEMLWESLRVKFSSKLRQNIALGLHSARYLNFRKAATCSHSQPLEWPQVAASGRSVEWPQVTASGRLRRVAEVFQSHKKQPFAATRSHSSGRKWPLFPSGRKWPRVAAFPEWPQVAASGRLYHITSWIRKLRKTPTRSRRQPTYPSQLEKKTPFQQNIFFQDVRRLSPKSIA